MLLARATGPQAWVHAREDTAQPRAAFRGLGLCVLCPEEALLVGLSLLPNDLDVPAADSAVGLVCGQRQGGPFS